jgi:8-oxo-dGTP diphosphatase
MGRDVEHGEAPTRAAAREVEEELGIAPPIGRLLVADWAPDHIDGDKLLFIFDGGILADQYRDQIRLQADEISGYEFHDVAQIHDLTIGRLARRIVHAHAAHLDGSTRYLEHGKSTDGS